jgi:uncharacterized protein (TIGR00255 family)
MIKSMTGFASVSHDDERATLGVTIRAVNHRFLDLQIRLPPVIADVEPKLRALLQKRLSRGRVEVQLSVQLRETPAPRVELNEGFVRALAATMEEARASGLVAGALTPGDLLRLPQALIVRERSLEAEPIGGLLGPGAEAAVDTAITQLEEMRTREGAHLAADLDERKVTLARLIDELEKTSDLGRRELEARLTERVKELITLTPADPVAVAQEIVRVAQRSDITEEVTRFRGHLAHWDAMASSPEPCGRKLDFLLQEMNREINTIASKADGLQVSERIIQAKAELERLREQVQNVE